MCYLREKARRKVKTGLLSCFVFSSSLFLFSLSLSRRKKNKKGGKKSRFFLSSSLSFFLSVFLFLGSVP